MKILLYGKNSQDIKSTAEELGFEIVTENPDVLISYGGDGTLLASEREFPEVPKLPIRDSKVCKKCSDHETNHLLQLLKNNQLKLTAEQKLEASFEGNKMVAINDIVIRNKSAYHAIRFYVSSTATNYQLQPTNLIIGDGIVASTPFGSTGYYQSITKHTFDQNFRIVFNNIVGTREPLEFTKNDEISIKIVRGPAEMTSDNNPETIELVEGKEVTIKPSSQIARIYAPETLRCTSCEVRREERLHK